MKIAELRDYLSTVKTPKGLYSLDGGLPSESYCIEQVNNKWHLYYSERGCKSTIDYYDNEDELVDAFLSIISKYIIKA